MPNQVCVKCVLPAHYPQIDFDAAGVCNYCRGYRRWSLRGEDELRRLFDRVRGTGTPYDCLVGASGGIDSTYALYYATKIGGLRALAFTADNGFIPAPAMENIKRVTAQLGVDWVVEPHDYLRAAVKSNLEAWMRAPSAAMIPMLCCGCRLGILEGVRRQAERHRIPLVISGGGVQMETCYYKRAFFAANPYGRRFHRNRQLSLLFGLLYELRRNPRYLRTGNLRLFAREYARAFSRLFKRQARHAPVAIQLFDYVEWTEERVLKTIQTELNWSKPVEGAAAWRSDCKLAFLKHHLLKHTVGFTEKDDYVSNMIRAGRLTRDEARQRLTQEGATPQALLDDLFRDIGVDPARLTAALQDLAG
jgi:hypothetical protein